MTNEIFADSVGRIDFVGGMVRFELASIEPVEGTNQGKLELRQRVIMPLEGFLAAYGRFHGLIQRLTDAGIVRAEAPAEAGAPAADAKTAPQSPNFG
jgi:hypothetical protein